MINYAYYYQTEFLNQDELIEVNELLTKYKIKKDVLGAEHKKADSYNVEINEHSLFLDKVNSRTQWINNTEFGYDLYTNYVSGCNLNNYHNDDNEYDWHIDSYPNGHKNDMKITMIVNISLDEYTGGKFLLMPGHVIEIKELEQPGSAIWFPSFTNHKVEPVTSGKRTSVSFWFSGPGFK